MNERVPLSFLLAQNKDQDPPVEPTVPFAAMFGDDVKIVTAVLDRTAVLSEPSDRYDRKSVRHDRVLVDPAAITWRTRTSNYEGNRILNAGMKPGSAEALGSIHLQRQPRKQQGSHWRIPITPGNVTGAEARQASDDRALQNQREVEAAKNRELAAHRKRQASAPQFTVKHEEEEMSVTEIVALPPAPSYNDRFVKKAKCFTCKQEKLFDEFPRPIHRGPNICSSCTVAKGNASTVTQSSATVTVEKTRKPRVQRKVKVTRAGSKPRLAGAIVANGAPVAIGAPMLADGDGRHTRVLALLRRQDALRVDLKRVSEEILELVAAG